MELRIKSQHHLWSSLPPLLGQIQICFHWAFCRKFNSKQLLFEAFSDECYCNEIQTNQKWKNKNHTVKTAVQKLPKNIENIDILFCLIDMKRYSENIDALLSYRYIDITNLKSFRFKNKFEVCIKRKSFASFLWPLLKQGFSGRLSQFPFLEKLHIWMWTHMKFSLSSTSLWESSWWQTVTMNASFGLIWWGSMVSLSTYEMDYWEHHTVIPLLPIGSAVGCKVKTDNRKSIKKVLGHAYPTEPKDYEPHQHKAVLPSGWY